MSAKKLTFDDSTLKLIFERAEFETFCEILSYTAAEYPEILGILVTGSLVQRLQLPNPSSERQTPLTPMQNAYQEIVSRARRKFFPHPDADLDIWLLMEDGDGCADVPRILESKAIELVRWYAEHGPGDLGKWVSLKQRAFGDFYKKEAFFPKSWVASNPLPYYAWAFKETMVERIGANLHGFRNRIRTFFRKKFPTEFLELRAFPKAVFNLRPEKIEMESGKLDRTPFCYYLKDWLDLEQNCIVIYTKPGAPDLIYPFSSEGPVLGKALADAVSWKHTDINYTLFRDRHDIRF